MAEKNFTRADLLRRIKVGGKNSSAGMSINADTSNLIKIAEALDTDPDELLGVKIPQLTGEVRVCYERIKSLPIEDQWLVLDILRAILRNSSKS